MTKILKIVGIVTAVISAAAVGFVCFCVATENENDWFLED